MHKRGRGILFTLMICLAIFSSVTFVVGAAEVAGSLGESVTDEGETKDEDSAAVSDNGTVSDNAGGNAGDNTGDNGTGGNTDDNGSVSGNTGENGTVSGNEPEDGTQQPQEPIQVELPAAVTNLVYNGQEQVGVPETPGVSLTGHRGIGAGSYEATALPAEGYVWKDGTNTPCQIPWSISRLEVSIPQAPEGLSITLGTAREYEYPLSKLTAGCGVALGELTYKIESVTLEDYYQPSVKQAYIENGVLKLPIQNNVPASFRSSGSVVITVEGANVKPFQRTISCGISKTPVSQAVTKITPTGTPTLSKTVVSVGEKLNTITLSGYLKDGEVRVAGTFAWENAGDSFSAAGQVAKNWIFTPVDTARYNSVKGSATFTVKKIMPSGTPSYGWIYTEGHTLASAGLSKGTITVEGTVSWELPSSTAVAKNISYRWIFVPADENTYERLSGTVVLYKDDTPAGGFAESSLPGRAKPITVTGDSSDEKQSSASAKSGTSPQKKETASEENESKRKTEEQRKADQKKEETDSGFDGRVDSSLEWIMEQEPEEGIETDGGTVPENRATPLVSPESRTLYQNRKETKPGVILMLIGGVGGLTAAAMGFALYWIRGTKDYRM
ncbi:MAG: hypothetical protein IJC59_00550 [Lachnospiraceae bacterium]|nr:hypothetical protein [Lachnospiraceae bacterium]